ncbi:MAG TPA: type II secretion system F family protein [Acidimicrobiales bacterium]|nr:type II secretion system F family protein [Acidimicrobiales bacterium]
MSMIIALAVFAFGGVLVLAGMRGRLAPAGDLGEYLNSLDGVDERPGDAYEQTLAEPFLGRIVRPLGAGWLKRISRLTPGKYVEGVHRQLVLGGVAASVRAEELVTLQFLAGAAGGVVGILYVVLGEPSARIGILALIVFPLVGVLAPQSWLKRKVAERSQAIRMDLPDTIDLLAISVEAGQGLEGAMQTVCLHFDSPLSEELSRTLKEMELGLARRDALHNLKRRTEVPELSNFVLVLTQADALGMPIGRVLRTQAAEMRSKRRQWAREKAAKLPVKILIPLVLFIFPAIMVVTLGPSIPAISNAF